MAVTRKNNYGIIRFAAAADAVPEDMEIEHIHIRSTAAGLFTMTDTDGFVIFSHNTNANELSKIIPINRRIKGLIATAVPTGDITVYQKMKGL